MLSCATVFDFEMAKRLCKNSEEVIVRSDEPEIALGAIVYDTHAYEMVLKFRFYVNECPPAELIAKATSKTENAVFHTAKGTLCAAWKIGFTMPDAWIDELGSETRDGFSGQFQQIGPGKYRVDLYGLLAPPELASSKPQWYDPDTGEFLIKQPDIIVVMTSLPSLSVSAELRPARVMGPGISEHTLRYRERWKEYKLAHGNTATPHQMFMDDARKAEAGRKGVPAELTNDQKLNLERLRKQDFAATYYKQDSRMLSYGEYWRLSKKRLLPFTLGVLKKIRGIPLNFAHAVTRFERLIILEHGEIPCEVEAAWKSKIESCIDAGFKLHFCYTIPTLSVMLSFGAALLNSDGRIISQVFFIKSLRNPKAIAKLSLNCTSRLNDRRFLSTIDHSKMLDPQPHSIPEYLPGASIEILLERHSERLKNLKGLSAEVVTAETLEAVIVDQIMRTANAKIAAGKYILMTPDEVERLRQAREKLLKRQV